MTDSHPSPDVPSNDTAPLLRRPRSVRDIQQISSRDVLQIITFIGASALTVIISCAITVGSIVLLIFTGIGSKDMYDVWTDYTEAEINEACNDKYNYINSGVLDFESDMYASYICVILGGSCGAFIVLVIALAIIWAACNSDNGKSDEPNPLIACCGVCLTPLIAMAIFGCRLCIDIISIRFAFYYYDRILNNCDSTSDFYKDFKHTGHWFYIVELVNFCFFILYCISICLRCCGITGNDDEQQR